MTPRMEVKRTILSILNNTISMLLNILDIALLFLYIINIEAMFINSPIIAIKHENTPLNQKSNASLFMI